MAFPRSAPVCATLRVSALRLSQSPCKVTPSTGTPQYAQVELLHSSQAPDLLHTSIYQDRTGWPNELSPLHPPMSGQWQRDIVPVCSTQQGSESN